MAFSVLPRTDEKDTPEDPQGSLVSQVLPGTNYARIGGTGEYAKYSLPVKTDFAAGKGLKASFEAAFSNF